MLTGQHFTFWFHILLTIGFLTTLGVIEINFHKFFYIFFQQKLLNFALTLELEKFLQSSENTCC